MSGIVIGRCRKSDGLLFYCPHTKHIYSSGDCKLDEGRNTPNTFNLFYEGGIFVGLYDSNKNSSQVEPYSEGTSALWPIKGDGDTTVNMRGTVISVPVLSTTAQIPNSAEDALPYVIKLVDGSNIHVSIIVMDDIAVIRPFAKTGIAFPTWLGVSQKVMFLIYIKGIMEYDLDAAQWRFSHQRRSGLEI